MNKSDTIGELAKALAAAQGEFEAVGRGATNTFFSSKYADLPTVVMAASPILSRHGLAVSQLPDFDGVNDLLTTIVMHESGEWLEATQRLYLVRQVKGEGWVEALDPQAHGSALTYGRRYAYSGGIGVVTEIDDDGNAGSRPGQAATTRRAAPNTEADTGDVATMGLRELTAALQEAKLPLTGGTEAKRLRLAEHRAGVKPAAPAQEPEPASESEQAPFGETEPDF